MDLVAFGLDLAKRVPGRLPEPEYDEPGTRCLVYASVAPRLVILQLPPKLESGDYSLMIRNVMAAGAMKEARMTEPVSIRADIAASDEERRVFRRRSAEVPEEFQWAWARAAERAAQMAFDSGSRLKLSLKTLPPSRE